MQINTSRYQIIIASTCCLLIALGWYIVPHPAVAAVVCLLPILFVTTLQIPFFIILMFVIFSFFRIHEAFPALYPLRIPLLLAAASLAVLSWHILITEKIKPYWRPEMTWLAVFFVLVSIGVLVAVNRSVAMTTYTGVYVKIGIMTLAVAWMTREAKDFALASKLIVIAGIAIAYVALYNQANGIGLVEGTRVTIGRDIRSNLGDPNDLALVLMFPMAFAVSLIFTPNIGRLARLLGYVGAPLLFSAVIATQSRGGLLGIMAVFALFGYRRIKSKVLFFSVGGIAMFALLALAGISERASGGAAEEGIDESAMGRLYAWQAAWGMALARPLTGVGLDNFYHNYFFYSPHWDGKNHAVHSTWFGVMAETGFLGLIVFIILIVSLFKSATRSLRLIESSSITAPGVHAASQAVLAGLSATLVSGTFLTQGFTWPLYILSALVIAIARWVDTTIPSSQHEQEN
ncbi:oligosaccharide repeat unit polymerase [Alteromonas sediminis]|uniref:Oligosaccharide repeat unit polymerase n=1 Tax=Alteromonas sediminis TaxID=2259342 RepID=A0A3N5YAI9_9ALTE|nr:O-antigen ligase family protein [Alteromonas sediminis]RPJ68579.1 oligosaccharide repeat unit polymerase [Alteromonas sediminis]